MECNMKDRVVMVSGGSNGIGRSAVEEFAKRGCKVVIFDYDETTVDEIREDCKGYGGSVDFRKVNMLEKQEIIDAFSYIKDKYGKLDYAFNNAGGGHLGKKFTEIDDSVFDRVMKLNVYANWYAMKEEFKLMSKAGFGRIINVVSGAGIIPAEGSAAYGTSKAALVAMTKVIALDCRRDSITVNAIAPGTIATAKTLPYKENNPVAWNNMLKDAVSGRLGEPYEIARVAVFLCEDDSSFINGVVIPVDGGFVAGRTRENL